MRKSKKKAFLLSACILIYLTFLVGGILFLRKFVQNYTDYTYLENIYASANEANIKGLDLLESNYVESSLIYFEQALEYAKEYQTLEFSEDSDVAGVLLSDAYNNICLAYYLLGEYDLSLENGNLAIEILPNESVEYSNRGNTYLNLGKYEEALQDYNRAIALDIENANAYYGKGNLHYNLGEYDKALQEFNNYLRMKPDDIDAYLFIIWCHYYTGSYDMGIEAADKALLIDENNIDLYDAKGYNIMAKSGYLEAESYYRSFIERYNHNIKPVLLLGQLYYNYYDYAKALEHFLSYKDKYARNSDLNSWIVMCYMAMGELDKADLYFNEVLEAGNADTLFCNSVGDQFINLGYYTESIKYYDEAIRIDEKDRTAYMNKLYALFYGKRYSRCIELGKQMVNLFGTDYDIAGYIGESYYHLCEYEDTLKWYNAAYRFEPESDILISCISDVYAIMEDYENAIKYANEALRINRNNTTANNIKSIVASRQRPIEIQVKEFIRNNYLYYNYSSELDQAFQNENITNMDIDNAVECIRRTDDIFTFTIYDELYDYYYEEYLSNVEYQDYGDMCYIRIYDFNENTDDQVIEILDSIEDTETKVLTIDLRMNGGGDTLAASNILDVLLSSCVTCTLIDKDGYTYNYYSDPSQIKFDRIFILVDGYTASASELLTLGLKTYINNVTIIGDNTYGKGVGQLVFEDKSRKLMVFLVNHFWNVREQNIKETGITPDIHIISDDLNDYLDIIKVK